MQQTSNYLAIQMDTVNSAFTENGIPEKEMVRILKGIAERITESIETDYSLIIKDGNGNNVGNATRLDLIEKPMLSNTKLGDFNLIIECDNAAFFSSEDGTAINREIARIIKDVIADPGSLELSFDGSPLYDINGNSIGSMQWKHSVMPPMDKDTLDFTSLFVAAENHLSKYIDINEAVSFDFNEVSNFIDAYTVFNPLAQQQGDKLNLLEIENLLAANECLSRLSSLELGASFLAYQSQNTPKVELINAVTQNIIDATHEESDYFALDDEEASNIERDIEAFKAEISMPSIDVTAVMPTNSLEP